MFNTLRADASFNRFWRGKCSTTPATFAFVLNRITLRKRLACDHSGDGPSDHLDRRCLNVVRALLRQGEAGIVLDGNESGVAREEWVFLGRKNTHIGIVGFVVGAGEKTNEQRLCLIFPADTKGVVFALVVGDGENCPAGGEELGIFDFVHCSNTLYHNLKKIKLLFQSHHLLLWTSEFDTHQ